MTINFAGCDVRFENPYGHDILEGRVTRQDQALLSVRITSDHHHKGKIIEIWSDDVLYYKDAE